MDDSEDFSNIIERAQRVDKDLGSIFGDQGAGRVAFQARGNRAGPALDFVAKVAVFNLPADAEAYEEVLNEILRGDAISRYEERTFSKEGDFLVAICYLEPRPRAQPVDNRDAGDMEPAVRPRKLP